jgi:GTP-binding protein HflX
VSEINRVDGVDSEAAILVGVLAASGRQHGPPLEELEGLAQTAGTRVVAHLTQRRDTPDTATYLGKGKVDQLKRLAGSTDADLIIFDNDLSPAQTRNLEKALGIKVLDRTELILDIFATRAQTHEARLAVDWPSWNTPCHA